MSIPLLAGRTWRDLRATARAHGLRFNTNFTKAQAYDWLVTTLLADGHLRRALNRLDTTEREALLALKAANGRLDRRRFCAAYGTIPRYRPWLPDALPHRWRHPRSLAEKLWFLGLIEVDAHRAVLLPDAVSALLPPVPHPQTAVWTQSAPPAQPQCAAFIRDLAALLGSLLFLPVRPLHGRWLPPYALKAINARLSQPEDLTGIRSEFHCQRLRFLHYVAQAAGLVSVQSGRLLPTPEAWDWLALPYPDAHQYLLQVISSDLRRPRPLWDSFRIPPVGASAWDFLLALPPGAYETGSLGAVLRVRTLEPHAATRIRAAVLGPLAWLGVGAVYDAIVIIHPHTLPEAAFARLHPAPDSLGVSLPPTPPLRPLAQLLAFATVDGCGLRLDAPSLARAAEAGHTPDHVARLLVALTGTPLPRPLLDQLAHWAQAAARLTVRHLTVLTVARPDDMRAIRADWRLRPFLGGQLSPHHIEVHDEKRLRQRLARRGYPLPPLDSQADPRPRANNDDPAYLWLAVRICQALNDLVTLPVAIPGAAAAGLEPALSARLDTLQATVDQTIDRVRAALRGHLENRPLIEQPDPDRIRTAVEQAQATGSTIRIRYYSPALSQTTERRIEPQALYDRHGATYIEAWCTRDDAPRTFRLDRILAII